MSWNESSPINLLQDSFREKTPISKSTNNKSIQQTHAPFGLRSHPTFKDLPPATNPNHTAFATGNVRNGRTNGDSLANLSNNSNAMVIRPGASIGKMRANNDAQWLNNGQDNPISKKHKIFDQQEYQQIEISKVSQTVSRNSAPGGPRERSFNQSSKRNDDDDDFVPEEVTAKKPPGRRANPKRPLSEPNIISTSHKQKQNTTIFSAFKPHHADAKPSYAKVKPQQLRRNREELVRIADLANSMQPNLLEVSVEVTRVHIGLHTLSEQVCWTMEINCDKDTLRFVSDGKTKSKKRGVYTNPPIVFRKETLLLCDITSISTGICPSAEDTSFIAIQVLSSTKLSSVKVGKNCPLDPLSNSGVPSRLIVVILPTTQLDEVKAYAEKNPSLDKKFEVDFGDDDPKSIQLRFDMYCAVDEYYFQNKDKQGVIDLLGDSTSPLKDLTGTRQRSTRLSSKKSLSDSNPDNSIVLFQYPMTEDAKDVVAMRVGDSLRLDEEYLNDNIIDFRIKYFMIEEFNSYLNQVHVFSCQFYSQLAKDRNVKKGYLNVAKWTKSFDLLQKDFVYIPINKDAHWSFCVIVRPHEVLNPSGNGNKSCILFMDSLNLHTPGPIHKKLIGYLNEVWRSKYAITEDTDDMFTADNVPMVNCRDIPCQPNGYDCGVYVIMFFYHFQKNFPSSTQEDIDSKFSAFVNKKTFEQTHIESERSVLQCLFNQLAEAYTIVKSTRVEAQEASQGSVDDSLIEILSNHKAREESQVETAELELEIVEKAESGAEIVVSEMEIVVSEVETEVDTAAVGVAYGSQSSSTQDSDAQTDDDIILDSIPYR